MSITRLTEYKKISKDDVLVVGFTQGDKGPEILNPAVSFETFSKNEIMDALKLTNFTGKKSELTYLTIKSGVLCVGLGKVSKTQPNTASKTKPNTENAATSSPNFQTNKTNAPTTKHKAPPRCCSHLESAPIRSQRPER